MLTVFLSFWTIACCSVLNRIRGGGYGGDVLPGRPLFWIAPIIGLLALTFETPLVAAAFAGAYLFWGFFAWGHLYGLGYYDKAGEPSGIEALLLKLAKGDVKLAFGYRMAFALPGLILAIALGGSWLLLPFGLVFAAAALGAYELAWRRFPTNPIWIAELATGALWGALIVF